jgi:predicted transposase YbfD/YdcC
LDGHYLLAKGDLTMEKDNQNLNPDYKILDLINEIPDPRIKRCQKHPLISIVFITLVASLCGANNWIEIVHIADALQDWIRKFVPLPHGIPSHDTFGRVFALIRPESFNSFLERWIEFIRSRQGKEVVSFDGKTLRGTKSETSPLHLLNAWNVDHGICMGQLPVDEKTNEIKIVPELIKLLDLKDCICTTDALNTQKEVAKGFIDAGADYVLPVKENHPGLLEDIKTFFDDAIKRDFKGFDGDSFETFEKEHGRLETRTYHIIDGENLPDKDEWVGVKSLGMVTRKREIKEKETLEVQYYINSIEIDAKLFERAARGHWGVENGLHWRLDVIFREDESRYRDEIGAQNLSLIRKIALSAISRDKMIKGGIQAKRLRAAASLTYRESVLKNFL